MLLIIDVTCAFIFVFDDKQIMEFIRNKLTAAVKKRLISDRPVCALLSGGLDSSLVCSIASKILKEKGLKLYTYSIGIPGSPDNEYAKMVADHIGSVHHTIELTEEDFLKAIPEVIYNIESYDTTTVRASVGNWMISKYIKENSDAKVIFNGDGSDEVSGGYMYFHYAPNCLNFDSNSSFLFLSSS